MVISTSMSNELRLSLNEHLLVAKKDLSSFSGAEGCDVARSAHFRRSRIFEARAIAPQLCMDESVVLTFI
jgi:hypothetical protein